LAIAEAVQWLLFSVADSITRTGFSQFNYGTEQHIYYSARVNKLKSKILFFYKVSFIYHNVIVQASLMSVVSLNSNDMFDSGLSSGNERDN